MTASVAGHDELGSRAQAAAPRPVGVTVTADGALLVSEDGNRTIWRIAYSGRSDD